MATYTPNIGLHQWEPEDKFLRSDFNEDFGKIDEAAGVMTTGIEAANKLASQKCRAAYGAYVGMSGNGDTIINLGAEPYVVVVQVNAYAVISSRSNRTTCVKINSNGFYVDTSATPIDANNYGQTYHYFALLP